MASRAGEIFKPSYPGLLLSAHAARWNLALKTFKIEQKGPCWTIREEKACF